ncbi:hypothetical protein F4780DRAFT_764129 [Xylariomycetidae sp. FL0641]|nr:hypothetical protein F4780DRAFT_764129 [Xylariomycetidae sp. FL0641]
MPSLRTVLASATLFVSSIRADYVIDPDSVSMSLRQSWCDSETSTCPLICQQTTEGTQVNTCDPKSLTYGCVCSDGMQPNISEYSLTLPYFVCTEWGNQCVTDCGQDSSCSSDCRQNHPCGAQDPTRNNKTTTSTSSSTSGTSTATSSDTVYTGLAGGSGSGDDTKEGAAFRFAQNSGGYLGFVALAAGLCAGTLLL